MFKRTHTHTQTQTNNADEVVMALDLSCIGSGIFKLQLLFSKETGQDYTGLAKKSVQCFGTILWKT